MVRVTQLKQDCQNCHSQRRKIKRRGLCSKCLSWQRKIEDSRAKLELVRRCPDECPDYQPAWLTYKIRVAERVMEELRWREAGLVCNAVDAERLESVVCAIARDCRSTVAPNMTGLISKMSAKSRRQMYEVLLVVLEGLPVRKPALHSLQHPRRGACEQGGWLDWRNSHYRSLNFSEDAKLTREHEAGGNG